LRNLLERFQGENIFCNAQMNPRLIRKYCVVDSASKALLENALTPLSLSARAYDRILKVSRTLADMEGKDKIESGHVSELYNTAPSTAVSGPESEQTWEERKRD